SSFTRFETTQPSPRAAASSRSSVRENSTMIRRRTSGNASTTIAARRRRSSSWRTYSTIHSVSGRIRVHHLLLIPVAKLLRQVACEVTKEPPNPVRLTLADTVLQPASYGAVVSDRSGLTGRYQA